MQYSQIESNLFVENRQRLSQRLKSNSIVVLNSNDMMPINADDTHAFIQHTDLFYLSGIDQEESTLVIFPDSKEAKHREVLFLKETNEQIATWEGPKYTKEEATAISGIKSVYWNKEFEAVFKPLVFQAEHIYLNTNEHLRANVIVETRDMRFLKGCMQSFPLHNYERLAPVMHYLRAVKSQTEIDLIKRACAITAKTFRRLSAYIKPGVWEHEIEAEIYHEFVRNRSRGPAFRSIIASGADSCVLHYVKNNKQCQSGDVVLIDFGAEYSHYNSDVTRTVPVDGRFSERQRAVYEAVLNVQKAAIQLLKPGNSMDEYHREVGKIMEAELIGLGLLDAREIKNQSDDEPLYKKFFPHGTSHHLGLDVHDYGDKYRKFEAGMVLTCEPGIYIKDEGFGVRIENDILVTDGDPVDLTADIPREAEDIEALMQQP